MLKRFVSLEDLKQNLELISTLLSGYSLNILKIALYDLQLLLQCYSSETRHHGWYNTSLQCEELIQEIQRLINGSSQFGWGQQAGVTK